jgi:hypothetical protein
LSAVLVVERTLKLIAQSRCGDGERGSAPGCGIGGAAWAVGGYADGADRRRDPGAA